MRLALLLVVVGCSSPAPTTDVVGPFTGDHHRFVIDRITLPAAPEDAKRFGDDLDGDGSVDNGIAVLVGSLAAFNNASQHAADMIASGALASEVEIVANDLAADDRAAVLYHGAPGDQPTAVGGRLSADGFAPNRSRETRVPGEAVVRLPVFADADPVAVRVVGLEIVLTRDGAGGFDGTVAGGVLLDDLRAAAFTGFAQMIASNPQDHVLLANMTDVDHNAVLTADEVASSPFVALQARLDVQLFDDGRYGPVSPKVKGDALSLGFAIHLTPCASGRCATGAPADPCHDRMRDGDETDVDCGGSCGRCPALAACRGPADCQTAACTGDRCAGATCSDGTADGFESDRDCGGNCGACAVGQRCTIAHDCATTRCGDAFFGGTCQP